MADKTPAEKMLMKPGMKVAVLHAPKDVEHGLGMPHGVTLVDDPADADFILDFATSQAEAQERLLAWKSAVGEKTLAWLAYPKGSKAAGYDVSRDTVFKYAQTIGLVAVANIAVDETWSALRIRPLAE